VQEQVGHHPANVVKEPIERGIPQAQGTERWFDEGPRYFEPAESVGSRHRHWSYLWCCAALEALQVLLRKSLAAPPPTQDGMAENKEKFMVIK
jgi:hypothetical protein